jgi:peptide-methionine (S)-S-oxide reductase
MEEKIVLGGGCFWCMEAVFQLVPGVISVISGYTGGTSENANYRAVCSGNSGHIEVVEVTFDPGKLHLQKLLAIFFKTHDPTSQDKQGADTGEQYRSAIFYHSVEQLKEISLFLETVIQEKIFEKPVVTEVKPLDIFYKAEEYHQNYYNQHSGEGYCQAVINPKLRKLEQIL